MRETFQAARRCACCAVARTAGHALTTTPRGQPPSTVEYGCPRGRLSGQLVTLTWTVHGHCGDGQGVGKWMQGPSVVVVTSADPAATAG